MTSTMHDAYDAQMLDYHPHDFDVHMNASITADTWTQEEAIMEDEGVHSAHKSSFDGISIEVDMEDYDVDHPEYDMLQNVEHRISEENDATELVDIEVYDVSQVHSPAIIPQQVLPDPNVSLSLEGNHPLPHAHDNPPVAVNGEIQQEQAQSSPIDHVETFVDIPPAVEEHHLEISVANLVNSSDVQDRQTEDLVGTDAQENPTATGALTIDGLQNGVEDNRNSEYVANYIEAAEEQDQESRPPEHTELNPTSHKPATVDEAAPVHIQQESTEVESYEDPHEISEGVYIDPPPAVLLTIDAADHSEASLFNEPPSTSMPPDLRSKQEFVPSVILLQNRPTLYYEPLSSLFEAFRQETFLSEVTDVSGAELVLDAYDLQLVMPEDNCYAREVSLHDLNMLHDAYDLRGPLRLRLRLDAPRFIIRYQRLQEGVAQLTIENPPEEQARLVSEETHDNPDGKHYQNVEDTGRTEEKLQHDVTDDTTQVLPPRDEDKEDIVEETDVSQEQSIDQAYVEDENDASQSVHETKHLGNDDGHEYTNNEDSDAATVTEVPETTTGEGCENAGADTDMVGDSAVKSIGLQEHGQDVVDANGETSLTESSHITTAPEGSTLHKPSPGAPGDIGSSIVVASNVSSSPENIGASDFTQTHDLGGHAAADKYDTDEIDSSAEVSQEHVHCSTNKDTDEANIVSAAVAEPTLPSPLTESEGDYEEASPQIWHGELEDEGELDTTWEYEGNEDEEQDVTSLESSVTLSSRLSSKRSFQELDDNNDIVSSDHSPGLKKPRMA
ncbi:hypothetical protein AX17_003452 [Amanita inopinata Kibby_2008]|nr:hypothetical protein AX17_003452 [Amanita inopinata Kibby_2008]